MGFLDIFKTDQRAKLNKDDDYIRYGIHSKVLQKEELVRKIRAYAKKNRDEIIKKYGKKFITVELSGTNAKNPTDSKIGGIPYISDDNILSDVDDKIFIAQINIKELPFNPYLPKEGILSFWVEDDMSNEDGYVYYMKDTKSRNKAYKTYVSENDEYSISLEKQTNSGEKLKFSVSSGVYAVTTDMIMDVKSMDTFIAYSAKEREVDEQTMRDALVKLIDIYVDSSDINDDNVVNNIFGYTFDIQGYPNENINTEKSKETEVVLLELEEMRSNLTTMYIGDSGILRFTNTIADSKKGKFNNITFHWDCS